LEETHPKLNKAQMLSGGILLLTFNDGQVRYLLSHQNQDISKTFTSGKNFITGLSASWAPGVGTECTVAEDGTLVVNGDDYYTPEQLWEESAEHIAEL
jgi:hypothetical protein